MDDLENTYSDGAMWLTSYTAKLLEVTLTGLVSLIKLV